MTPALPVRGWRGALIVGAATVVLVGLLVWGLRVLGPSSVGFAFLVVWLPMTWLGTISRVVRPRLPEGFHRLRPFEQDGRIYERVGVRIAKQALRRGPLAAFNPDLHLPKERTAENLAHLDQRMRDAEAAHAILFVVSVVIALNAMLCGWWAAAAATVAFDIVMNGYPVMLQRYNRARLAAHS